MLWGVFDHVDADGRAPGELYRNRLLLADALDRLGAHAYFVAEHHGTPLGLAPSPNLLLAAIAPRTTRLRLGALLTIAPLHHPVRVAEEACMLDHLSGGRLQLGLGKGAVFLEHRLYGVEPDSVSSRYEEARDIVMRALTTGEVDHRGEHFHVPGLRMVLQPAQRPHPPLWYGLGSPSSATWAAEAGINCVCLKPAAAAAELFDLFRAHRRMTGAAGPEPLLGVNRHVVVGPSDARARAVADAAFPAWRASFEHLWKAHGMALPMRFPETWAQLEAAGVGIAGSAATVRDYFADQRAVAGATFAGCQILFGTMPLADAIGTAERLAHEVMPALAAAEVSRPAAAA